MVSLDQNLANLKSYLQNNNKIVIASNNANKVAQIREAFNNSKFEIYDIKGFAKLKGISALQDTIEDCDTYLGNARKKAEECSQWSNCVALADDSGLEVECLDNQPGIYSGRYAGENKTGLDRIEKLLKNIKEKEAKTKERNRKARYRCVLCLVTPEKDIISVESEVQGEIQDEPKGKNGFCYDPIFKVVGYDKTYAELTHDELVQVGFRYKAAFSLLGLIS